MINMSVCESLAGVIKKKKEKRALCVDTLIPFQTVPLLFFNVTEKKTFFPCSHNEQGLNLEKHEKIKCRNTIKVVHMTCELYSKFLKLYILKKGNLSINKNVNDQTLRH